MSRVYRFHRALADPPDGARIVLRKRPGRAAAPLVPVAADARTVTDSNGTRPLGDYKPPATGRAVTLTRREADLLALANPGIKAPEALEDIYPWLPSAGVPSDSRVGLRTLTGVLARFEAHLVGAAAFCDARWATICNALGTRTRLDARFFAAWHAPVQDAFVLEERRPGRSIVALDVNAMFPACMQHPFPDPGRLRRVDLGRDLSPGEELLPGLYRCVLHGPPSPFLEKHNPFRSFFLGQHLRAALSEPVEVDLNEFEVAFLSRHVRRIHLVDAVTADRVVPHPLAREARRCAARRAHFRAHGNEPLANREKFLATLLSSCSQRPRRGRLRFASRQEAAAWLLASYGIGAVPGEPVAAAEAWQRGRKGIVVSDTPAGTTVDAPDLLDPSACFMLNQRIVARSRVVLLAMMERLAASTPEAEICYANIDSIHVSVRDADLPDLLASLATESSDAMGAFRVETVARHGLWLEPGRYWLYGDRVEKFRNRGVGDGRDPFRDHAIRVGQRSFGGVHVPVRTTIRMDRTMSAGRTLVDDQDAGLVRLRLVEAGVDTPFVDILARLGANAGQGIERRMAAFRDLQLRLDEASSRCLGTG